MNRTMQLGLFFLLTFVLHSPFAFASSEDNGSESIVLKGGKLGNVVFPHGRHQRLKVDCRPCHALFPKESGSIENMKTEAKLKNKYVMVLCKFCHKGRISKGTKAGPTTCKGCHEI